MTRMTLYSGPLNMFGAKAQIACLEKGLSFDRARSGSPALEHTSGEVFFPPVIRLMGLQDLHSYADIASYMAQIFAARMGAPMTGTTPRLMACRLRVGARPAVDQVTRQFAGSLRQYKRPIPDFIEAILSAGQQDN